MSYPPPGWVPNNFAVGGPPPPMPTDYSYGKRAWTSGSWMYAPDRAGPSAARDGNMGSGACGPWQPYPGYGNSMPPPVPPKEDYWATELMNNPLGLENMHIRSDEENQAHAQHSRGGEENLVWVPALHDNEHKRGRSNKGAAYHAPVQLDPQDPRATSQPPPPVSHRATHSRNPSPAPPVPELPAWHRDNSYPAANQYVYPEQTQIQAPENTYASATLRPRSSAAHRDREHERERDMRRRSAEDREYYRLYGARPSDRYPGTYDTLNPDSSRSQTLPTHRRYASVQAGQSAGAVQRSQTMPVEPTYARVNTVRTPHKYGERYEYTYQDVHRGEYDDRGEDDDYVIPHEPAVPKESNSMERVRKWIAATESEAPKMRRATTDGYDHRRSSGSGREDDRVRPLHAHPASRDPVSRHAAAAAPASSLNPALAGVVPMSDITEEPEEISRARFFTRQAPADEDEDNFSSSSSSDSGNGRPRQPRILTPHPASSRRLPDRADTLRVDDAGASGYPMPSPRSLNQKSRTPSARSSYEHVVHPDRDRELNGHHLSPKNGHLGVGGSASYSTPPITPTRQDYMYRHDDARSSPYAMPPGAYHQADVPVNLNSNTTPNAVPGSSSKRAAVHEPSPSFQTPARLAYLYRGSSASPSPRSQAHASATAGPSSVPRSSAVQPQYYESPSAAKSKSKKRSPHGSRSPSPLNHIQAQSSSSNNYYASLSQSQQNTPPRAAQGHAHILAPQAQRHSHSHSLSQAQTPRSHSRSRRSSSRATAAAAAAASTTRHVRAGLWNRRGDHLTESGYVVYCPPGRNYPRDLVDYPDNAFKDHQGRVVADPPDRYPELPESIPQSAGRPAERNYDSFITYLMVNG
ncbi:hypothetical protein DFH11DRAFT_1584548 [Phellopilus nigrolimitatus]|nr:hypothetical protein DFH11DRAFT_1584548 [Phellopilus nigrolimitatus]